MGGLAQGVTMYTSKPEFDWPNRKQRVSRSKPPRKGDEAVGDAAVLHSSAAFRAAVAHRRDNSFREGWFCSADNLARDIIQQEALKKLDSERAFYGVYIPMLYCYRHYLELALKHLIVKLRSMSGIGAKLNLNREHGLIRLWNEATHHANDIFGEVDSVVENTDKNVERILNEIHQFDSNSQTFRYHRDKQGRSQDASIPEAYLPELIALMRGLRNYFRAWEDRIWDFRRHQPDG